MERGRNVERKRKAKRGGPGLAHRQACSVRAMEDKVVQGLVSCLIGCSGGFLMG